MLIFPLISSCYHTSMKLPNLFSGSFFCPLKETTGRHETSERQENESELKGMHNLYIFFGEMSI